MRQVDDLKPFLEAFSGPDVGGFSVTMPHKVPPPSPLSLCPLEGGWRTLAHARVAGLCSLDVTPRKTNVNSV